MYDLPRPGKGLGRSDDGSPPKCIRPLASGLLLQPGHDEIRALRSQINGSCRSTLFCPELTMRRSTVSPSFLEPRNLLRLARQAIAVRRRPLARDHFNTRRRGILIGVHSRNHRRMPMPYRATLPVRSKRGAVQLMTTQAMRAIFAARATVTLLTCMRDCSLAIAMSRAFLNC